MDSDVGTNAIKKIKRGDFATEKPFPSQKKKFFFPQYKKKITPFFHFPQNSPFSNKFM